MTYGTDALPTALCFIALYGHLSEVGMRVVIGLCITLSLALPLGAQEPDREPADSTTSSTERPYRNPHRALLLGSLIPGAGHIYSGEYVRGFLTYEATVGAIGMGTIIFILDRCTFTFLNAEPCKSGPAWPHQVAGVAVVSMGIWMWVRSARDAPRAAERANDRHRLRTRTVAPIIEPFSGPANASKVGVSVHW